MTSYSKTQARELVQSRLSNMTSEQYIQASATITVNAVTLLAHLVETKSIKKVLLYEPIQKYREIDIASLQATFPAVLFDFAPQGPDSAFPTDLYDCIFIPLYGFDSERYRLGHGAGWYDKLLHSQPQAIKIGVGFEAGLVDFAVDPHDVPMDGIITESRCDLV